MYTLAASLDAAKAFDKVRHKALLSKILPYEFSEKLCKWIGNFVTRRSIKFEITNICSALILVNVVVPQGCVLSPTLFILDNNDLLKIDNFRCCADDSTVDALYLGHTNISPDRVYE
ncbi:hypothetical protein EVAR_37066_1 [Eumeta japonica]|uniref:Reverse transcriptase domain-containing protein n=1 Tax=Eumeta variegata TaxID=151549 RepID=A0A4C1WFQ5_EUMVA|nr:hypothetical protein EVAR_37066_1 [Eumeta japonica]